MLRKIIKRTQNPSRAEIVNYRHRLRNTDCDCTKSSTCCAGAGPAAPTKSWESKEDIEPTPPFCWLTALPEVQSTLYTQITDQTVSVRC